MGYHFDLIEYLFTMLVIRSLIVFHLQTNVLPSGGKPVFNCNPGQLQQGGWDDLDTYAIKIV